MVLTLNRERLFARLLAKEDVIVQQSKNAKTASFNVATRVLTFPAYKDMSPENWTGFTCHEVGHALHTTIEVMELTKRFGHTVINVCEDLRINNLMKKEFSGVSNIFLEHYTKLNDRKFFGNYSVKSGFIDKINIANKMRINLFDGSKEQTFWNKFSNIETIEELIEACEYVVEFYKKPEEPEEEEQEEEQEEEKPELDHDPISDDEENSDEESEESDDEAGEEIGGSEESEESDDDNEDSDEESSEQSGESDEDSDEESEKETGGSAESDEPEDEDTDEESAEGSSEESEDEGDEGALSSESDETESDEESEDEGDMLNNANNTDEESEEESEEESDEESENEDNGENAVNNSTEEKEGSEDSGEQVDQGEDNFDVESITSDTEESFESNLEQTIDTNNSKHQTVVPKNRFFEPAVIPMKDVVIESSAGYIKDNQHYVTWTEFQKSKKDSVNHMVQTFNRHKSADEFHRRRFSNSGSLNMSKLHQHKTSEDIFLRNMKVSEGKSHGLVFFLDTSGSMGGRNGTYTVKQISIMVDFCRTLGIPYSVYGYTSHIHDDLNVNDMIGSKYYNIELMSHKQSKKQNEDALFALYSLFSRNRGQIKYTFNGDEYHYGTITHTPLHDGMFNSIGIIDNFKKSNGVDIMNIMYFTDGSDGDGINDKANRRIYPTNLLDAETNTNYVVDDYDSWWRGGIREKTAHQGTSIMISKLIKKRFNSNVFFMFVPTFDNVVFAKTVGIVKRQRKILKDFIADFQTKGFFKVENGHGVEQYALYVGEPASTVAKYDDLEVAKTASGSVTRSSMTQLRERMLSANVAKKGKRLFAELVSEKVAQGFK